MKNLLLSTIFGLSFIGINGTIANAEVLIAPTRVVLENGDRSAELVVVNKGEEQAGFRVSVENRRMLVNGSMEEAKEIKDGELFAADYVRFSPRRIVLEPGARQTVRVSVNTSNLTEGEYRSHLRLMSAPMSAGRALANQADGVRNDISIQLVAIRSLTIPVIVRVGKLDAEIQITETNLTTDKEQGETYFVAKLKREGSKSTYGDINLYVDGEKEPVYFARGIAVYTPNTERDVILPIPVEIREMIAGKSVRISYVSSDPSNPETYAEYSAVLN